MELLIVFGIVVGIGVVGWRLWRSPAPSAGPRLDDPDAEYRAFLVATRRDDRPLQLKRLPTPIETTPPAPPGRPADPAVSGMVFDIEYVDADGVVTSRRVRLRNVYPGPEGLYFDAYCEMRRGDRTFIAHRVAQMITISGEQINYPASFLEALVKWPNNDRRSVDFDTPPEAAEHRLVMGRARPGLVLLVWTARADDGLAEDEIGVIFDYIRRRAALHPGASVWSEERARVFLRSFRPTLQEAIDVAGAIVKRPAERALVVEFLRRMVEVDGVVTPVEEKRLNRFLAALGEPLAQPGKAPKRRKEAP